MGPRLSAEAATLHRLILRPAALRQIDFCQPVESLNNLNMFSNGFSMPRLDRMASVYLCHPAVRLLGSDCGSRVPILMYHSISENQFGKTHPYFQINTSPE